MRDRRVVWAKKNPLKVVNTQLKFWHGITLVEYNKILSKQSGRCCICRGFNLDGRRLAVDHCHRTGKIRGLLCDRCNRGIGLLRDRTRIMKNALKYVKNGGLR